jgi:hypothetical protein
MREDWMDASVKELQKCTNALKEAKYLDGATSAYHELLMKKTWIKEDAARCYTVARAVFELQQEVRLGQARAAENRITLQLPAQAPRDVFPGMHVLGAEATSQPIGGGGSRTNEELGRLLNQPRRETPPPAPLKPQSGSLAGDMTDDEFFRDLEASSNIAKHEADEADMVKAQQILKARGSERLIAQLTVGRA